MTMATDAMMTGARVPFAQHRSTSVPTFASTTTIAGANDAWFALGTFFHKDGPGAVKNVTEIGWRSGSTMDWGTGPSTLRISIQSVGTGGPSGRYSGTILDDGGSTADGYADRTSGATSSWLTDTLTGAVDMTVGSDYAVVFQITGLGGGSAPSLGMSGITNLVNDGVSMQWPDLGRQVAGTYSGAIGIAVNIVFKCSDNTFGAFKGALICSATGTHASVQSSTSPDEYGNKWAPKRKVRLDGLGAAINASNSAAADFTFTLSSTPTASMSSVDTITFDGANLLGATLQNSIEKGFATARDLTANTAYGIAVRATSTGTMTIPYLDVADANHCRDLYDGVTGINRDGGSGDYAETTTRIYPFIWGMQSGGDDGAGGSGSGIVVPAHGYTGIGVF